MGGRRGYGRKGHDRGEGDGRTGEDGVGEMDLAGLISGGAVYLGRGPDTGRGRLVHAEPFLPSQLLPACGPQPMEEGQRRILRPVHLYAARGGSDGGP